MGEVSIGRATYGSIRLSAAPRALDMLPDGRMIGAVTSFSGGFDGLTWEIRVVLNWLDELKAKVPPA